MSHSASDSPCFETPNHFPPELLASFQCPLQSAESAICWYQQNTPQLIIPGVDPPSSVKCPFGHHEPLLPPSSCTDVQQVQAPESSLTPFPQYICVDYLRNECHNQAYLVGADPSETQGMLPPSLNRCAYGFHPTVVQLYHLEEYLQQICHLLGQPLPPNSVGGLGAPDCTQCANRIQFTICHFGASHPHCTHLYCASCYSANQPNCPMCTISLTPPRRSIKSISWTKHSDTPPTVTTVTVMEEDGLVTTTSSTTNTSGDSALVEQASPPTLRPRARQQSSVRGRNLRGAQIEKDLDFGACLSICCIVLGSAGLIIGLLYLLTIWWGKSSDNR